MKQAKPSQAKWLLLIALGSNVASGCSEAESERFERAPRLLDYVAHGAFFTAEGDAIESPSLQDIEHTQQHIIRELEPSVDDVSAGVIFASVDDLVLARAVYIEELISAARPPDRAGLRQLNGAMRNQYLRQIGGDAALADPRYKGLDPDVLAVLETAGIEVLTYTEGSGADYVEECRAYDVPVPDTVLDESAGWVNRGVMEYDLLGFSGNDSEIWSLETTDPPGVCLALPRWFSDGTTKALGLICLNRINGKTCFFDGDMIEPPGYARGEPVSIYDLVGGTTLNVFEQWMEGGTCSDCHAGENPFIVHPEMPVKGMPTRLVFDDLLTRGVLRSGVWPDPIVPFAWPQNPGPLSTPLPDTPPDQGRCDDCHNGTDAGRFPLLSTRLPRYCNEVKERALNGLNTPDEHTMPPSSWTPPGEDHLVYYADHIEYLDMLCGTDPPGGFVWWDPGPEDDPDVLGPPEVYQMYLCADEIAVSRARFRAEVQLLLDGVPVSEPREVRNPDETVFQLSEIEGGPIAPGQQWTARQRIDGGPWSALSEIVEPRDHHADYPGGVLPAPQIVPTPIFECGLSFAIGAHVPGATLFIDRSVGPDFQSPGSSKGWTGVFVTTQLTRPEKIAVAQSLCGEAPIEFSDPVPVEAEPLPFGPIAVPPIYEQQELILIKLLVHGTTQTLTSSVGGAHGLGAWPTSVRGVDVGTLYGPISLGETIEVTQQLCDGSSSGTSLPALSCDELRPPEIVPPRDGDTEVRLADEDVPGSAIRVWSVDEGREIGDSSGSIINLVRPLAGGETLKVTRALSDSCRSPHHFETQVL